MKLKNLSRLTALLLAVMTLFSTALAETYALDLGDLTEAGLEFFIWLTKCETCREALLDNGIYPWPECAEGYGGLYDHLNALTVTERYSLLNGMDADLRQAYIDAHAAHVADGKTALLCTCDAGNGTEPGGGHDASCPWHNVLVAGLNERTDADGNTYYILALMDADGNLVEVATAVRHPKDPDHYYLKDNETGLYVAYLEWDENGNARIVPLKSEYAD